MIELQESNTFVINKLFFLGGENMIEPTELYEQLWYAGIVFAVFAMSLIVCSFIIWCKKEKWSKFAYIISMILTIILYFANAHLICDSYLEKGGIEIILFVLGIASILSSIFFRTKGYIIQMKIMMNIAMIMGFIMFSRIVLVLN